MTTLIIALSAILLTLLLGLLGLAGLLFYAYVQALKEAVQEGWDIPS